VNYVLCLLALLSIVPLWSRHGDATPAFGTHEVVGFGLLQRPDAAAPVLGVCDAVPNYVDSRLPGMPGSAPALRRWASFPVTYSVDTSDLPESLRSVYDDAGEMVRELWSSATGDRVGRFRRVPSDGQIAVSIVEAESLPAVGYTTVAGLGNVITRGAIRIGRLADDEPLLKRGLRKRVTLQTANTLAHEIGHALGIQLHSPNEADLMSEFGNFVPGRDDDRDARSFITAADRNTMLHAYCH
jgi:hypothetical protein